MSAKTYRPTDGSPPSRRGIFLTLPAHVVKAFRPPRPAAGACTAGEEGTSGVPRPRGGRAVRFRAG